jgi:hypothetical protein
MRYFVLPHEGLSDDMQAALTRGLGLSPHDAPTCERHCRRYGVTDVAAFLDELGEAQASLATARMLSVPVMVDWRGRLCYDLPGAPDLNEEAAEGWQDDAWLASLFGAA